jgi:hypothetical protein
LETNPDENSTEAAVDMFAELGNWLRVTVELDLLGWVCAKLEVTRGC